MSTGMPELGSKISLISKADIRYEGRLFTVDPLECTIALASVRSFGTEDRETQFAVAPQNQVYDYILFRGSDIKDIRVVNSVPSVPNDPAIMQLSVPASLGGGPQYPAPQYQHPVIGSAQYPQYHPMTGLQPNIRPMKQPSELGPLIPEMVPMQAAPVAPVAPPQQQQMMMPNPVQVKDQGSMLDLIGGNSGQNHSRSATPSAPHRKSPTADQGTQVGPGAGGQREGRRNSSNAQRYQHNQQHHQQPHHQPQQQQHQQQQGGQNQPRNRPNSRNRNQNAQQQQQQPQGNREQTGPPQQQQQQQHQSQGNQQQQQHPQHQQHHVPQQYNMQHQQVYEQSWRGRGAWRGRGRGRGGGGFPRQLPGGKTLKFDKDYDFEQANTEFEELRSKLAKAKISEDVKAEPVPVENGVEIEKKDDSGNETGAGEAEPEEEGDGFTPYDKAKSFFDNISCEAVERQKGRSQRTDWRTERKLNSETFGVASARRGAWRGRGGWRQYNMQHQPWRAGGRGGRGRGGNGMMGGHLGGGNAGNSRQRAPGAPPHQSIQQQPQPAAAK